MTDNELAEKRLLEALDRTGGRDPRSYYRDQLRLLKDGDRLKYQRGTSYYKETLIPRVAEEDSDPLAEWLEYGRLLVSMRVDGETVQIDPTGLASPYSRPVDPKHLVLHMPASAREPAIPVGLPTDLSPAQRAAFDLLVKQHVSH